MQYGKWQNIFCMRFNHICLKLFYKVFKEDRTRVICDAILTSYELNQQTHEL